MASPGLGLAYHNHDHLLPLPDVIIPTGKQPGLPESGASTDLVGVSQDFLQLAPMAGKKIRMALGYVPFAFLGQLDFRMQVGAGKPLRHGFCVIQRSWKSL
jgi:hypothetical protein